MKLGFEITQEDVHTVLIDNFEPLIKSDDKKIEQIFGELDFDSIEKCALYGDDLENQTDYAFQEIRKQIMDRNLLYRDYDAEYRSIYIVTDIDEPSFVDILGSKDLVEFASDRLGSGMADNFEIMTELSEKTDISTVFTDDDDFSVEIKNISTVEEAVAVIKAEGVYQVSEKEVKFI